MTLNKNEITVVQLVLSAMRKTKNGHSEKDLKDIEEVIHALHAAGYIVVSKGLLAALKKLLDKTI